MEHFKTFILGVKDKIVQAAQYVGQKLSGALAYVRGTKVYQTVVSNIERLKISATSNSGRFVTILSGVGRVFGISALIYAITKVIFEPKKVALLWRDWKNNHRRIVAFLWEVGILTGLFYVFTFIFKFLFVPMIVVLGAAVLFSLFLDFVIQLRWGDDWAFENTRFTFAPARWALRTFLLIMWVWPQQAMDWKPRWLADFCTPRVYTYGKQEALDVTVSDEEIEIATDDARFSVITKETIYDSTDVEPARVREEVVVAIDAKAFQSSPKKAGHDLAATILENSGMADVREYRRTELRKQLQRAGLTSPQIVGATRGYDEVMLDNLVTS